MKNKAVIVIISFMLFMISCSDIKENNTDNTIASENEKKVSKPVRYKKKKTSAKAVPDRSKKENVTVKTGEEDEKEKREEKLAEPQEKAAIRNILASKVNNYAAQNDMSTEYCFLVDMSLPSGKNRFFIYDLKMNTVVHSGLVAHGSCNETFLSRPRFSNETKGGCSSLGKYKLGEIYRGKYGRSYRLYGLDNCNSNAFKRAVVIHAYDCVPDGEIYPRVLCNSLGCPMVSNNFFKKISWTISKTNKPILLWIYQ